MNNIVVLYGDIKEISKWKILFIVLITVFARQVDGILMR